MPTLKLPPSHGTERDQAILKRVAAGAFDRIVWASVPSQITTADGRTHTAVFLCATDSLKMEGVRINSTPENAQQMDDMLFCIRPTAKMVDLRWLARAKVIGGQEPLTLLPSPQPESMDTSAWESQSATIDGLIAAGGGAPPGGILATLGKEWINDNETSITDACEYGWHFPGPYFGGSAWEPAVTAPYRVIQGRGWFHSFAERLDDYSMKYVPWSRECVIDGQRGKVADVLTSPELAPLASHQGVLHAVRFPQVAPYSPLVPAGKADIWIPLNPPSVALCPNVSLPALSNVLPWPTPPSDTLKAWAAQFLNQPLGAVIRDTVEGLPVVARVECHSPDAKIPQWHKGVTAYKPAVAGADGKLSALDVPPVGWPNSAIA